MQRSEQLNPSVVPASAAAWALPQHEEVITHSHLRSREFGLESYYKPEFASSSEVAMKRMLEGNQKLLRRALPAMEILYTQIANTRSMVILSDSQGCILHTLGDKDFLQKADQVALKPGVMWDEQQRGTNAVGTALSIRAPVTVHGKEHYLRFNQTLTCSAAPIIGHDGDVLGVLDVSGDHHSYQRHTLALASMSSQIIENQLFNDHFTDAVRLHFHLRPEFIGTMMEGLVSFTSDGVVLSANRIASTMLAMPLRALRGVAFEHLFSAPISLLLEHFRTPPKTPLMLRLTSGVTVWVSAELPARASTTWRKPEASQMAAMPAPSPNPFAQASNASTPRNGSNEGLLDPAATDSKRFSHLRYLNTGDAHIAQLLQKISKVLHHDMSLLILGETGTGKELLAHAMHQDSPRSKAEFVSLHCASATLEELASSFAKAAGGTLFLDEVAALPIALQNQLLHLIQQTQTRPSGVAPAHGRTWQALQPNPQSSPKNSAAWRNAELLAENYKQTYSHGFAQDDAPNYAADSLSAARLAPPRLVSASHAKLRELIDQAHFREDLYFHLNGVAVRLPPLRERSDLAAIILRILHVISLGGPTLGLSAEVAQHFKTYAWPGNVRQLHNLLYSASLQLDAKQTQIELAHLSADFLEDLKQPAYAQTLERHNGLASATNAFHRDSTSMDDMTAAIIQKTLDQFGGNVSAAARVLGISRNTIYRKLQGKA